MGSGQYVIQHRHAGKQPDVLERARHAMRCNLIGTLPMQSFAFKINLARCGFVDTGKQVKDSRLARAVWTNQSEDLSGVNGHVQLTDCYQSAETDGAFISSQDGVAVTTRRSPFCTYVGTHSLSPLSKDDSRGRSPRVAFSTDSVVRVSSAVISSACVRVLAVCLPRLPWKSPVD